MKIFTIIAALFFATSIFASTKGYQINMEISVAGQKVAAPKLILVEGEVATIASENDAQNLFLEFVATEGESQGSNKGILLKFEVSQIESDGSRTIVSRPVILAKEGEEATIAVGEEDREVVAIKIIAYRKAF